MRKGTRQTGVGSSEGAQRATGEDPTSDRRGGPVLSAPAAGHPDAGDEEDRAIGSPAISAASLGVPKGPRRFESPKEELRPGEVDRGAHPVGSRAASASTGVMTRQGSAGTEGGGKVNTEYRMYVGIDWATEAHQACVLDGARHVIGERSVAHTGAALAAFAAWLSELADGVPARVAVAMEVPRGAVVETLVERGVHVYAINPKQLDRFRDRHTVAGAKDDRRDAFVLADAVRTDRPCFRRVRLDDPLIIQLRELSRVDGDLMREAIQLANRLRELLHRFFPQVLELSTAADEPWLWALLEVVPTPAAAHRVRGSRVEKLLRAHRIRRVTADTVLTTLRTPALAVAPGVVDAAREHIALLLPRLRLVHAQRQHCAQRIEALLQQMQVAADAEPEQREHRDVEILRSLPGVGRLVTATVLAEASAALTERDYHSLRAHAGLAPITKQSGKRLTVHMRYACNQRLRNALYHWARVAVISDAASRTYYATLRQRGHTHGRALRSVADRLLRILIALLNTGSLYDPHHPRRVRPTADLAMPA